MTPKFGNPAYKKGYSVGWAEALEEAALLVEGFENLEEQRLILAAAIRALKDKRP